MGREHRRLERERPLRMQLWIGVELTVKGEARVVGPLARAGPDMAFGLCAEDARTYQRDYSYSTLFSL